MRRVTHKLHLTGRLFFRFFILPTFHTQDTCALVLKFEVGHFARHFLLLSFCCIVTTNYTYTYTCGNSQHNNDERTHFFRKIYLSLYSKWWGRVVKGLRVRGELETEQTATYWTPSSFVFSSTSFTFCWAAQSGVLRAHSPLLGAGSLYGILSPTNWTYLWHRVI